MNQSEFEINDLVSCFCEEMGEEMEAQIFQFRNNQTEAYIHFLHQDKRLDRWVLTSHLSKFDAEAHPNHQEERVLTRYSRRLIGGSSGDEDEQSAEIQHFEELHKEVTKIRNIDTITIGKYSIRTWYFSPYPKPFGDLPHLYICEKCFQYFDTKENLDQHVAEKQEQFPPGREIYRKGNISIFELQGRHQKFACQSLCLLAKLFLDHKTLYYDVEGFVFYVLCECDSEGAHAAAYYSRELASEEGNILACIVVFPPYQKKGYGRLLISLSYELAKRQKVSGGPERPLSDLGKIAFHSYSRDTIIELLRDYKSDIQSIDQIERLTSIEKDDIIEILKEIQCVVFVKGEYELDINKEALAKAISKLEASPQKPRIDPMNLIWFPEDDPPV
ncbi:MOZ/SAS family protein [Histomonas meleagridis]|uniref:MOZ/SAS family protein n=1 Tax=Histomonas meleagridis TaxID=135588 RepID=UPI003559E51D|nr:MOZ/SAS family protein [Histomonas meleagridis]KAH0806504.1 MOZ/SAS family protein [Histomonas meleagridis]